MKIRIETDDSLQEPEVLIRSNELGEDLFELQRQLQNLVKAQAKLSVIQGELEYFLKFPEIIFMETDGSRVAVHTHNQIYFTKQKLYELEEEIPGYFVRVSKSTILNTREIRSIRKNITGASEIEFANTPKKTFVSRSYYKALMEKMVR